MKRPANHHLAKVAKPFVALSKGIEIRDVKLNVIVRQNIRLAFWIGPAAGHDGGTNQVIAPRPLVELCQNLLLCPQLILLVF
jgi:hypothetical protein